MILNQQNYLQKMKLWKNSISNIIINLKNLKKLNKLKLISSVIKIAYLLKL